MQAALRNVFDQQGYRIHTRPYELNIIGIRSTNLKPETFDDRIVVCFTDAIGKWFQFSFAATTDPGTYWLHHPMNDNGTAILMEGQYLHAYQIGLHRGLYNALVQRLPVTIIRDYDRDALLDFQNGYKNKGFYGINIHHARSTGTTKYIDKYSAGCQVLSNISDFNKLMLLANKHREMYGNSFSYTLIDERSLLRSKRKISLAIAATVAGVATCVAVSQILK